MKNYSLKKSTNIFFHACTVYKKKKSTLDEEASKHIEFKLDLLKECISKKDKPSSSFEAKYIESYLKKLFPMSTVSKFSQSFAMLVVALFFAIVIRQTCFELMEIPTGSMRPTFREGDKVIVSKTQFGINTPLKAEHLSFDPEAIRRMGTVVFSGEGMDIPNVNTTYFLIFPGVKKMVKRMIGLPGDSLYFYGGKIYGVDINGKDISGELQQEKFSYIEHIPYININGRIRTTSAKDTEIATLEQNHIPLAAFTGKQNKAITGNLFTENFSDLHEIWGMGNYAMTRIVPTEKLYFSDKTVDLLLSNPGCKHFLEITHHASLNNGKYIYDYRGFKRPAPGNSISYLPLHTEALKTIWDNLYTSRFNSNKGYLEHFGKRYDSTFQLNDRPKIKGHLQDSTYEILDGIAYKVKWQNDPFSYIPSLSVPEEVELTNPLAHFSEAKCVTLYNMGIEQSKFIVNNTQMGVAPSRYAYYRDGSFYLMGKEIFSKESETLKAFALAEENKLEMDSSYVPFVDSGAPLLADGSVDTEKVKQYGLHVPLKSYYVLGDNHAQSGDSREFGFVPEKNIRGVVSYLFWAPGGRFGAPIQIAYSWYTIHKVIVWSILFIGIGIYYYIERKKRAFLKNKDLEYFVKSKSKPLTIDLLLDAFASVFARRTIS